MTEIIYSREKLYEPGNEVYFIRRCSENTALLSDVEIGTVVEYTSGWVLDPHIRIAPQADPAKSIIVPQSRVWKRDEAGRKLVLKYVESIRKRQETALRRVEEKLEASKWKLNEIDRILNNIPQ